MKNRSLSTLVISLLVLGLVVGAASVGFAAQYPSKPITLIAPSSPGGSTDIIARTMAPFLEKYLGQPITVVNKPAANGTIATTEFKNARPDGYSMIINFIGNFTIQPFLRPLGYELDDFRGVIGLSYEPIVLAVNAKSPYKSVGDLVEGFKNKDKALVYGVSSIGTLPHLAQAALYMKGGVEGRAVPFQGGGPALTALVGQHVDAAAGHPVEVLPHVQAGNVRPLAVFSKERIPSFPEVPTAKEAGYDVGEFAVWKFILVPAATPDSVVKTLHDAFAKVYDDPEFKEKAEKLRLHVYSISGEQVIQDLRDQQGVFEPVVKSLGLKK